MSISLMKLLIAIVRHHHIAAAAASVEAIANDFGRRWNA
jgi:hypothetical protein